MKTSQEICTHAFVSIFLYPSAICPAGHWALIYCFDFFLLLYYFPKEGKIKRLMKGNGEENSHASTYNSLLS